MESSSEVLFTQQIENSLNDDDRMEFEEGAYGRLISMNQEHPDVVLAADVVTIGRQSSCTVCFKNNQHLSSVHCQLTRDHTSGVTFLEDRSSNGTYVNGVQLGKGNRTVLKSMDEISLLPTKYARYIYKERTMDEEDDEDGGPTKEYHIQKTLGSGNFASVKLAICKTTGGKYALKCIDRKKMVGGSARAEAVRDEINILQSVSHPNIIKIHKNYETDSTIFLVLELVEGGELFDFIVKRGEEGLPEASAREIFRQIVEAVAYLHNQGIGHRDLKPENILLGKLPLDESGPFVVKLSDFGLSRLVGQSNLMQTMCGTPSYLAPEVLSQGSYGVSCDVWSMGVILYILLSGRHPFDESSNGVLDRIKRAEFSFDECRAFDRASAEARDCIERCLVADPNVRITASQLLQHPFITGEKLAFAMPMTGSSNAIKSSEASASVSPKKDGEAQPVAKKAKKQLKDAVPVCKYGQQCFRKNPQHFKEFAHPWLGNVG